jgi:putative transposase
VLKLTSAAAPPSEIMDFISPNSPAYYLTSVAKDRLPVFRTDKVKSIACSALNEARASCGFLILAYVIMPDHFHIITDGEKKASVIQRFINGITSRRLIDFLKQEGYTSSLEKLRHEEYRRGHRYSLWDHHPNVRLLTTEGMFMQRVHYTHQNPARLGLVEREEDYRFSSARIWNRRPLEDEPVLIDNDKIRWRKQGQRRSRK